MPKLLQKNIFKASIITALLGFIVVMIFVGSILHHGKIAFAFDIINLFFIVAEMSIDKKSMFRFVWDGWFKTSIIRDNNIEFDPYYKYGGEYA